ncbi:hypothetical protein LUZ60_015709 [Juncus effusus]|nr:hypothetical protein LUZ60_015709 [Juncus effusus]
MPSFLSLLTIFSLFLSSLFISAQSANLHGLGVNYGTLGDNLPTPEESVQLLKKLNAGSVKLYDANPAILSALARTGLRVSIMVPNQIIPSIAASQSAADVWVSENIVPYYRNTRIRYLLVGNEILTDYSIKDSTWPVLVPAMRNLHRSLRAKNIRKIKIGTPLAMDALSASFPPSNGTFRQDISSSVIRPLLTFLRETKSYFFIDVYSYFPWSGNRDKISLNYALFQADPKSYYHDPVSRLTYTNLLDQMLDSVIFAMKKLGFGDVKLAIAETGWPNGGDVDQVGANAKNAEIYNKNLAKRMVERAGTPARPGRAMPIFVFSLYNENQKPGSGTERHWGMYYPDKKPVYNLDLSVESPLEQNRPLHVRKRPFPVPKRPLSVPKRSLPVPKWELPVPKNHSVQKNAKWCVFVGGNVNETQLQEAVNYACGQGSAICNAVQNGGACFEPNSLSKHADWAFNSYWQQFRTIGGTCDFNGLAVLMSKDPSYGSCKFPNSLN